MKFIPVTILILSLFAGISSAQPDTLWTRTYGGTNNDYGRSILQTNDGGFVSTGCTASFGAGNYDIFLIKTDSSGNQQWMQTFGGSSNDYGYCVQQTNDNGFIIAGYTSLYPYSYQVYLVKTDSSGNQMWSQTFGGSSADYGYYVQQTADDGFIICGSTNSYGAGNYDVYLLKTDAWGNLIWFRTFGGSGSDLGSSVYQTLDSGYIISGYTMSFGNYFQTYLIKTDEFGFQSWYQTYGGSGTEYGRSVRQTSDGGYIIAGLTSSYGSGSNDIYLIKTDSLGIQLWQQTFGGQGSDEGESVHLTIDSGFIVAGCSNSFSEDFQVYLVKTDSVGIQQWSQTFGGTASERSFSVQQNNDGGYIICGYTYSYGAGNQDVYLIRLALDVLPTPIITLFTEGGDVMLSWNTIPSASEYRIYYQNTPYFTPTGIPQITILPPDTTWIDLGGVNQGARFYRIIAGN